MTPASDSLPPRRSLSPPSRAVASRRGFLLTLGAVAAAPSLRLTGAEAKPEGEAFWEGIRRRFAFREERVPMNAANLCPASRAVTERVASLTQDIDRDCSFNNRAKFAEWLEGSRAKVAAQLGCAADEIALVRNTTEGNNIINNGLPLRAGDEVIVWDQNHPTNNVAWDVRAARFGLVVKRVATPASPQSEEELLGAFLRAFTDRTRVLAVTHVSNVTGVRLPIAALCAEARRRDIHVHVDGAQTWGALQVNLRELGCDSYTGSAHKWFMGPKETGLLYVRAERIGSIWPGCVAPGWGTDAEPDVRGARKFESLGQRDDASLAAVATAAELHDEIGSERVERRVFELAQRLKSGLANLGLSLITPMSSNLSAGVCVASAPSDRRQQIVDRLYSEFGIAGAASGGIRLCPHIYNTSAHVDRALEALKTLRRLWG